MTIFDNIVSIFAIDIKTALISLIIGFIVYKTTKFYLNYLSLPPGPIPVPLFGNILQLRSKTEHWSEILKGLPKKYGPVFTFYLGSNPFVFICDIDLARDAFRRNAFTGRPESFFGNMMANNEEGLDVVFNDYGNAWEVLRKVSHSAVQKYAITERLENLATDCVDRTIDTIIKKEGFGKPFVANDYIFYMFLNILSTSAYNQSYDFGDKECKQIQYVLKDHYSEYGLKFLLWEFVPISQRLDKENVQHFKDIMIDMRNLMKGKFMSHYEDYDKNIIRDFCDALICAKNEALSDGKESAVHLNDSNLAMSMFDLLFAGTDTSQLTFKWMLLYMLYYPNVEKKLRQEIESQIGDRMPTHEDRNRCHYVMAFITEMLRIRNVVPPGMPHNTISATKIGEHTIPKGTGVFVFQSSILMDEKYWSNPDQFNPDRFLENGKMMTTRPSAYIPFGVGRRVCLGEKLAIADLFLVFVRFLQKTSEYVITLHSHNGLEPDPLMAPGATIDVKEYQIVISKKS